MKMKTASELELIFRDVNVTLKTRSILHDVSGVVHSGEILAVMGPSGSGKTTLLSTVAGRQPFESGEITLNSSSLTKALRRKMCYVLQEDIFFSNLTLWETLYFAAMIHLPEILSHEEKLTRIDNLLESFDLVKCKNTIMGGPFVRGVSGGEKKRASIACELLSDPDIMLLDEPTSGLDSSTALSLMVQLKKFTEEFNKGVIVTIHQPSSQIFHKFSRLLLLAEGNLAYFGDASKVLDFLENTGLPCSPHYNPADFILEVVKKDKETLNKILQAANEKRTSTDWPEKLRRPPGSLANTVQPSGPGDTMSDVFGDLNSVVVRSAQTPVNPAKTTGPRWETSLGLQYRMLCWRAFKQSRSRILSKYSIATTVVISIVLGLLWFQMPRTYDLMRDRMGLLFFVVIFNGFGPLLDAVNSFPAERPVMMKERAAGWYRVSAYYLAKMTSEMPLTFILPAANLTVVYWMAGFKGPAEFFATLGILLLSALTAQSVGLVLGTVCFDLQLAFTASTTFMLSTLLTGGFYSQRFPFWLDWLRYTSFVTFSFNAMCLLEFSDTPDILCANVTAQQFPRCADNQTEVITSTMILYDAGIRLPIYCYVCALVIVIVVLRIIGYWATRICTRQK